MAKVKTRKVKSTLDNADVQELFARALGEEGSSLDYSVVWPKFKRVRRHVARGVKIIEWLTSRPWICGPFPEEGAAIRAYVNQLKTEFAQLFEALPDLDRHLEPVAANIAEQSPEDADRACPRFDRVPPGELELFSEGYKRAVESDLVNTLVVTCRNLTHYKASLEKRESLRRGFLLRAGLSFAPIPNLPAANFKSFYHSDAATDNVKETILLYLHRLYHITHEVYEAASDPDFSVDDLIQTVSEALEDLKTRPELERCDDAFQLILNSTDLLRNNFKNYYRDMKNSGNPSVIMENFVLDVADASKDKVGARVRSSFQKIIRYYRKVAKDQPKNSKSQVLINELEKNFSLLERSEGVLEKGEAPAAADEDPDGPPPDGESAADAPPAGLAPDEEPAEEEPLPKEEVLRRRKQRARARKTAAKGIETFVSAPLDTSYRPSALARDILGESAAGGDA